MGGSPLAWLWGVRGWALLQAPTACPLWACGRGPLPIGCASEGCGREDPSPTPQRALLPAGFARCGYSMRARGEGASCLCVRRPE